MRLLVAGLLIGLMSGIVQAEEMRMVDGIRGEHPRIILTDERVDELKGMLRTDADLQRIVAHLEQLGDFICTQPPVERKLVGTKRFRLLGTSRLVLARALTLGTLYRLDGQAKWKDRLTAELKAVCAFEDWYPRHFLDTAEMSAAVALGYDWLYNDLSEEDRLTIRDGLVRHGLKPGLKDARWVKGANNWNQVCHCGMTLAALAVAEDEPGHAEHLLQRARSNHVTGLRVYDPAGVYPEGPGYWNYGTSFSVVMASALESVLGDDWGILDRPAFRASFDYRMHVQGPTGKVVNYADGGEGCASSPYHFYVASRTGHPGYSAFAMQGLERDFGVIDGKKYANAMDRKVNRLLALAVAWYVPEKKESARPLDWSGGGDGQVHVAFMRSAWQDPKALFASLKGGRLQVSHGHLDSGSFMVEADGVRWAGDLGSEREIYDRSDSWSTAQDSPRWTFFRANSFSHNTLTIDGQLQRVDGTSPIMATGGGDNPFATVDLSAAYAGQAQSVKRGVMMPGRKTVLVRDEIVGVTKGKVVRWNMTTRTRPEVSEDGKTATLHYNKQTMSVRLLSPADGQFSVADAKPATDIENPNKGWQRLVVDAKSTGKEQVIGVLFVPGGADVPEKHDLRLEEWGRSSLIDGVQALILGERPLPARPAGEKD